MELPPQTTIPTEELALNEEQRSNASANAMQVRETSTKILTIIFEYTLNKFDDFTEQHSAGMPMFLSVIDQFVTAGTELQMCLPAFPFKSANKVYKVFGILPDKAEELALNQLNAMCLRIGDVYPPGAKLTIISDGLVYNGVSNTNSNISPILSHFLT